MSSTVVPQIPPLTASTKVGYGIGEIAKEIPSSIMVFFLLFFLTNVAGLSPSLAGTVLLVGKCWDAINDPIIGWLSDRTQTKWGKRFPWMIWGAVPLGVSFWLLWLVPPLTTEWQKFGYYTGALTLLFAASTAIAIPHATLGAELTQTYDERTQLMGVKAAFSIGSSILGLVIAQVIFSLGFDKSQRYAVLAGTVAIIIVVSTLFCVWMTYQRYWQVQTIRPPVKPGPSQSIFQQLKIAFKLRPFVIVMGIYLCSWVGLQVTAGILQYYVVDYLRLSDQHFTQSILAIQGTALIMMLFWSRVAQRVGKRKAYCWGIPLTIVAQLGLAALSPNQTAALYILGVLAGLGLSTAYLVPWSMLPDVMDLDELMTGQRREGIFCGIFVQLQKFGTAMSVFMVGKILDWSGYISHYGNDALSVQQPDSTIVAIRLLLGPVPALVLLIGIAIASTYPITRERHQDILKQLAESRR